MGNSAVVVRKPDTPAGGQNVEDMEKVNDAVNSLVEAARLRHEGFVATVKAGKVDQTLIPIDKIISDHHILRGSVTELDGSAMGKEVGEVLGSFCDADTIKVITDQTTDVVNLLFGSFKANLQSEYTGFLLVVGAEGGLFRIETYYYACQYDSSDLMAIYNNVVSASVVISSAGTSNIDRNVLRVIISQEYGSLPVEEQQKRFDQMEKALASDKNSLHYKRLNGLADPYEDVVPSSSR